MIDARIEGRVGALGLAVELGVDGGGPAVVVGPNGAGKTTLLRMLLGVRRPDRGRIVLGGRVVFDAAAGVDVPPEARGVGYVPQGYGLFPHLTALENVAFGLACRARGASRAERRARARAHLEALGVAHVADHRPAALSGGEQQRVALARALAAEPRVLLLDEPLAALDRTARRHTRAHLAEHLRALALPALVVTHDPDDARALAGTVFVLEGGRVVQSGTPEALARAPATEFVRALFADGVRR